ncbi:helicase-exonuclease AddAB subunit AddB [Salipaludibacillus sp. CUR1]|uniref:helicase-exonuclease AddAB subunit AddB n=1 Tax=Salipaludibacillus sp. CUR1 TaxID=2820003 RepID=UPI001E5CA480|nr:helicase-exonuclease AddAB subunit AddB [Salipaludibacillus sp. CUR1]MCE7792004.1 helicase-exonuclease AddAB subunit AddB [Salipaludibacillus sp. CUR1]
MAINFVTGRAGSGKTTRIEKEILELARADPQGAPVIYLVPDQMTFQVERNLIKKFGRGMTRVQVLSFSRLALRVLQEVGGISRYHIEKTGIHMLIRKIIERNKDSFLMFQKTSARPGFVEKMEQTITEMKRYQIDAETLQEEINSLENEEERSASGKMMLDKLVDIHIILSRLEKELADKYVGSEDYLQLLAEKLPESGNLNGTAFYIDGFYSFTPVEMNVLREIFKIAEDVTISLTLDEPKAPGHILHPLDLFYETGTTYQQLILLCEDCKLSDFSTEVLDAAKRFKTKGLQHLEANGGRRPAPSSEDSDGVNLISAVHKRGEVERVAREITSLVRSRNYRYGEIAILLRNMGEYADYFETVFRDEGIPFFMDEKRSALNHPLVEFIRSTLEIIHRHWRYESVFRALKTEFLFPESENIREKVDQLENYVLAYGIQGKRWYSDERWTYHRMKTTAEYERDKTKEEYLYEEEINSLREDLLRPVFLFQKRLKKSRTVKDYCTDLFQLLEDIRAAEKLERLRNEAAGDQNLREAREHDQMWDGVIHLFDQMVETSGDEPVSFELFMQMIDTGFESMKFSIIPPAFDQVVVASMETSRLSNIRCAFIMGVNDGVIPAKPDEGRMISEEERELLEEKGLELAPGAQRQLLNENFLIYMAQSTPSEKLYLTYPLADEEGRSLQPSMILNQLYDLFPSLEQEFACDTPADAGESNEIEFINHPQKTLSYLTQQLQGWKRGYPISKVWWDTYNWFINQPVWSGKAEQVLRSLTYHNKPEPISRQLTEKLYGKKLKTSVSRMEQFNACPFSQFANYGLKLKERETYKLEAPDIGTLFHAALKEMAEALREKGKDFSHLSKQEAAHMAKTIVDQLAPKIQRQILLSSSRFNYIQQKLEQVVARASAVLAEQAKKTGFSPAGLEVGFGPDEQLPPLTFQLENGYTVELAGRIDRVDKAESEEGLYVRILDYKSSSKDINLDDVYYGLAMQMLIYLDVVLSFAGDWLGAEVSPAGVLYFHVHNPMIQAEEKLTIEEIEEKILKEFKMKGLLSSSLNALKQMDLTLEQGHSDIVPAGLKKDGKPYANSKVISPGDYENLRSHLRNHVKQIGESILNGNIALTPYKKKQKIPCTFCSFKSFCQFDASLDSNDYRHLPAQSNDDILKVIRGGGDADENES